MATTVKNSRRRRFVTTMTAFLAISVMGVAFAAWTATGTGSGSATALDPNDDNLVVDVTVSDGIYPTGAVDVAVSLTNPNPYEVTVASITDDSISVDGGDLHEVSDCALTFADQTGLALVVPADSASSADETFTGALSMGNAAIDDCKGASIELTLSADGESS